MSFANNYHDETMAQYHPQHEQCHAHSSPNDNGLIFSVRPQDILLGRRANQLPRQAGNILYQQLAEEHEAHYEALPTGQRRLHCEHLVKELRRQGVRFLALNAAHVGPPCWTDVGDHKMTTKFGRKMLDSIYNKKGLRAKDKARKEKEKREKETIAKKKRRTKKCLSKIARQVKVPTQSTKCRQPKRPNNGGGLQRVVPSKKKAVTHAREESRNDSDSSSSGDEEVEFAWDPHAKSRRSSDPPEEEERENEPDTETDTDSCQESDNGAAISEHIRTSFDPPGAKFECSFATSMEEPFEEENQARRGPIETDLCSRQNDDSMEERFEEASPVRSSMEESFEEANQARRGPIETDLCSRQNEDRQSQEGQQVKKKPTKGRKDIHPGARALQIYEEEVDGGSTLAKRHSSPSSGAIKHWDGMFIELKEFYKEHGHFTVPELTTELKRLANFVGSQRRAFRTGRLRIEREESLRSIDFPFKPTRPLSKAVQPLSPTASFSAPPRPVAGAHGSYPTYHTVHDGSGYPPYAIAHGSRPHGRVPWPHPGPRYQHHFAQQPPCAGYPVAEVRVRYQQPPQPWHDRDESVENHDDSMLDTVNYLHMFARRSHHNDT